MYWEGPRMPFSFFFPPGRRGCILVLSFTRCVTSGKLFNSESITSLNNKYLKGCYEYSIRDLNSIIYFKLACMKPPTTVPGTELGSWQMHFPFFISLRQKNMVFLCLVYWYLCRLDRERKLTSLISYAPVCNTFVCAYSAYLYYIFVLLCTLISSLPHETNLWMHHGFANCFIFYFCGCAYALMCLQLQISTKY